VTAPQQDSWSILQGGAVGAGLRCVRSPVFYYAPVGQTAIVAVTHDTESLLVQVPGFSEETAATRCAVLTLAPLMVPCSVIIETKLDGGADATNWLSPHRVTIQR
jgi:hypothetical protein